MKSIFNHYTVAIATTTILALGITSPTYATPLRLDYTVEDIGGGLLDYDFRLVVDNNDGSYVSGQVWNWIIFGDIPNNTPSPLTNWVGDLSNSSPFVTGFTDTVGGHNGLTILGTGDEFTNRVLALWEPNGVGDFLQWSGTSTANLLQGDLLFSTLQVKSSELPPDFGVRANFEVANRVNSFETVPEPATILGLATVLGFGVLLKRRNAKKQNKS